ncbi:MoaD/ThiS family protein [Corynebacterium lizhenjunii]|uniref:MoaD/ThiS family protein n=1 Tax=Corynebacterium lizhenjunii TaxID=2709394 RepID=UPI0013E9E0AA|nr:MoaD/ThiS family protein [Corynebacterium lizhenjunii]
MLDVHYFAAARQAAGTAGESVEVPAGATLADALATLRATHSGTTAAGMSFAQVLEQCSFLVDGRNAQPQDSLAGAQRLDILPPFAGG